MTVAIEKAGRSKVRLTFTDAKGAEACAELTEQQIETLHTLCRAALTSKEFSMSVEMTVKVSGG